MTFQRRSEPDLDAEPRPGYGRLVHEPRVIIVEVEVSIRRDERAARARIESDAAGRLPGELGATGAGVAGGEQMPLRYRFGAQAEPPDAIPPGPVSGGDLSGPTRVR